MIKKEIISVYSGAEYSNLPLEMYVLYLILLCGLKLMLLNYITVKLLFSLWLD